MNRSRRVKVCLANLKMPLQCGHVQSGLTISAQRARPCELFGAQKFFATLHLSTLGGRVQSRPAAPIPRRNKIVNTCTSPQELTKLKSDETLN